ncbi:MAG: hypothetical protein VX265_15280, partial [Myxococcota bacterium]|nr:hypothetical protein [Myxococcota bacterium]
TGAGPGPQGQPPRTDRMFRRGSSPPRAAAGPDDVDPEAVLGLDDPIARKALDRYLDAYMQARQEDASYDDESQFIEHASAAIEMYGEDANLSDDVQERILQRLETANTNWFEIDRASAAGDLDSREVLERRQKIEESVTRDMIELLGEESWEELAGRIW